MPPQVIGGGLKVKSSVSCDGQGPAAANYGIDEVVYFHIAKHVLVYGVVDPPRVDYVSRIGGDWYARSNETSIFALPRLNKPRG